MKAAFSILVTSGLLLAGCSPSSSTSQSTNAAAGSTNEPNYASGNPLTAVPDYYGVVVQAQKYSENVIDVSYINQDIQLFNASEGRYPKNLQELIPSYLAKMPVVPNGFKLDYDPTNGTVKVVRQ
ncbi:MAG TPA: hypothetical protein VMB22_05070 [Verrucomicrobiae bacterium]|nr:hypothetical protein [Verrucomicrobiae bacterium]